MHACVAAEAEAIGQPGVKPAAVQPSRAADAFYAKLFPALEVIVESCCSPNPVRISGMIIANNV